MIIFHFLTGLAAESVVVVLATYLARPKQEIRCNKDKEEYSSWRKFFNTTWAISVSLICLDLIHIIRN